MADNILSSWRTAAVIIAVCACAGPYFTPARAETAAQFDVTATVAPGCLVDGLGGSGNAGTIGELDFGSESTFSTATRTASAGSGQAIRLRCTPGVDLQMRIDGGLHAAAGIRHLQRGGDPGAMLAYSVCRDAACNEPIGIGGTAVTPVTGANSGDVRLPIHGALTLPGTAPPGTYTDTLTVTLTW